MIISAALVVMVILSALFYWYPQCYVSYSPVFRLRFYAVLRWEKTSLGTDDTKERYLRSLTPGEVIEHRVFIFQKIRDHDLEKKSLALLCLETCLERLDRKLTFNETELSSLAQAMDDSTVGSLAFIVAVQSLGHSPHGISLLVDGLLSMNQDCRVNCLNFFLDRVGDEWHDQIGKNVNQAYALYGKGAFGDVPIPERYCPNQSPRPNAVRRIQKAPGSTGAE
jgi:hypothetical protein